MLPTKFRFIWPSGFRVEDFSKSANQKQEFPMATIHMFVNGSGQNEHYLERICHRCFLPSFTSFDWGVLEEKIKMWKVKGRRTPSDGKSSRCLWQGELKMWPFNTGDCLKDVTIWAGLAVYGYRLCMSHRIHKSEEHTPTVQTQGVSLSCCTTHVVMVFFFGICQDVTEYFLLYPVPVI